MYSYESENPDEVLTLKSANKEINEALEAELVSRFDVAGIKVLEARICHLAYSAEIAGAMLGRQIANTLISARSQLVNAAVNMVESAVKDLEEKNAVKLEAKSRNDLVSSLMVVLCSDIGTTAQPVINLGSD
jgi:regulator of protease activity HflC (stomatin/prohibitin superfamily)